MGFWSGIKHALNSTLGTADFQPLDKIFTNNISIGASDMVLKALISSSVNIPHYNADDTTIKTFTAGATGTVRLVGEFIGATSGKITRLWCEDENGENIGSVETTEESGTLSVDVNVKKGKIYVVHMIKYTTSMVTAQQCTRLSVCGNPIYGKLIS